MPVDAKALPGEAVITPDPMARAKKAAQNASFPTLAVLFIVGLLCVIYRQRLSWGDIPTWVLAITTLLAFLAASFAGLVAYDLFTIEAKRDLEAAGQRLRDEAEREARREADRRVQANKVTAWFDFYDSLEDNLPISTWGAVVRNASDLPILDVQVRIYWVIDPGDGSPWTADLRYESPDRFRVLPPGQSRHSNLPQDIRDMEPECNDQTYLVAIDFTDNSGARWTRDARGALAEAKQTDTPV